MKTKKIYFCSAKLRCPLKMTPSVKYFTEKHIISGITDILFIIILPVIKLIWGEKKNLVKLP